MSTERLNPRNKRIFDSVFGGPTLSQPTPVATPVATPVGGFTTPGQAFGGPPAFSHDRRQPPLSDVRSTQHTASAHPSEADQLRDQLRWDRSWHTVTHALVPPDVPQTPELLAVWDPSLETPGVGFVNAMLDVLDPQTRLPDATHTEDIITWHTNQVRHHFLRQVLPVIMAMDLNDINQDLLLLRIVDFLGVVHRPYLGGLGIILTTLENITPGVSLGISERLRRDLHAIINHSVSDKIALAMKVTLRFHIFRILGLPVFPGEENVTLRVENYVTEKYRAGLLTLVRLMQAVGLAGEQFQISFAEMMHLAMVTYVTIGCKGIWSTEDAEARKQHNTTAQQGNERATGGVLPRTALHSPASECVLNLCEWIENGYSRLAVQVFHTLGATQRVNISWRQVEKWKEIGIAHIGKLRTDELYDIVVNWPRTTAALDDLKTAVITPRDRLRLTDIFAVSLSEHVLHAGVSTLQILQTYISMISSFHALDHSRVLLDRVSFALQLYLCKREDTVRIIITGLLSDTEDAQGNPIAPGGDKLVELAILLNNGEGQVGSKANDDELDWHDRDWVPEPIDAGPGYKRSKNSDILGTLIDSLGSEDVFIKEFQAIIGEHLLKNEGGFEKEVGLYYLPNCLTNTNTYQIKVLELLKSKFGEAPLQSCEVMLKDIQDSGRLNSAIRRNQKLEPSDEEINIAHDNFDVHHAGYMVPEGMLKPSLHAKILSRLYWPQLQDVSYRIPDEIGKLQGLYEAGFETLKAARKLTWLHSLGQATVELELADRKITEEVHTWQAVVIWDFQSDEASDEAGDDSVRKTVAQLVEHLEMDETLVRSALKFWVNKLVLQEVEKDVFSVLETLNQEDRERSNAQAAASAAAAPDDGMDDAAHAGDDGITAEKGQMYWQFIQGMLKNSSSQMPLQQIAMMLKMLIADGFPYSNEELQVFLGSKVTEGELEFAGGKYRLKR